ncbi:MAG: hypothetical protein QOJ45_573 [Verrucomicrobiota bacterium]
MQAGLFVIESFAHDRFLQNMKWLERRSRGPGRNLPAGHQLREIPDLDLSLVRFRNFDAGTSHFLDLFVKERREKKELGMAKAESIASLGNPAFAHQNSLFAAA